MEKYYINKRYNGHILSRQIPVYEIHLIQTPGGTIYANPMSGFAQTEVTLSNTPSQDYVFNGYEISGSNLYETNKFKFVDSDVTAMAKWTYEWPDPNPLNLPTNTMRVKCYPENTLYSDETSIFTVTEVGKDGDSLIYDIATHNNNWGCLNLILSILTPPSASHWGVSDILGVNNSGISSMQYMFAGDTRLPHVAFSELSSICYFDTSNVVDMRGFFQSNDTMRSWEDLPRFNTSAVKSFSNAFTYSNVNKPLTLDCLSCSSLASTFRSSYSHVSGFPVLLNTQNVENWSYTFASFALLPELSSRNLTIPDYDFSNATNVSGMFLNNPYVSGGISSTYAKLSALGNQITAHSGCFRNCGVSSEQGRAELALIPNDWK